MSKEENMLIVAGLSKRFGTKTVVDNLSFTLKKGLTLGVLGPNGAGKTTTIRMLMGLSKPTSGKATILGYDLQKELKKIHSQIGVVFEKPNLFENLSGYQNLVIFCRLYKQSEQKINPFLERMDLQKRAHDPVKTYSKGMRQRILIIRALLHQPQLLFLDEPCSGLDPISSRVIRDYLLELKKEGITILLTSHDMAEVDELCDFIAFMKNGKLVTLNTPQQLKKEFGDHRLQLLYYKNNSIQEKIMEPTPENMLLVANLAAQNQLISLHSREASLEDVFRKL